MNSRSETADPKRIGRKELKDLKEGSAPFSLRSLCSFVANSALASIRVYSRFLFVCLVCFVVNSSSSAVFTNNLTLSETNTAYDGQDIVISGANLRNSAFALQPSAFPRVSRLLTIGAVLTDRPSAATNKLAKRCGQRYTS
jgi:hypothetical protein